MFRRRAVSLAACCLLATTALMSSGVGPAAAATSGGGDGGSMVEAYPSSGGPVGTVLTDNASIFRSWGNATGTVDFELYGPDDQTCAGAPVYSQTAIMSHGVAWTAPGYTTTRPGTYTWRATYSGDSNNAPGTSGCYVNAPGYPPNPVIAPILPTMPSKGGPLGVVLRDTAIPSGGTATGTVDFNLFAPWDTTCGNPIYTETVALDHGSATTSGYTSVDLSTTSGNETEAGMYRWTATYIGDGHDPASVSQCGGGTAYVEKIKPIWFEQQIGADSVAHVRANLLGVTFDAGGTVTYAHYSDSLCSLGGQDAGTVTVANGIAPASKNFSWDDSTGFGYWQASYSGDANNPPVTSVCGYGFATNQTTMRTATAPSPGGPVGTVIYETASPIETGPGGYVDFSLYAPWDSMCVNQIAEFESVPLVNGTATSPGFATSEPGTYRWRAYYTGTDAYTPYADKYCGDPTVVTPSSQPSGWTSVGSQVLVAPVSSAGTTNLMFDQVSAGGDTATTTSSTGPAASGFSVGGSPVYYDISTKATYSGPISVCLPYDPSRYSDPSNVRLYHYANGAWSDVTSSVHSATEMVCGVTSSLSPFVVGEPATQQSQSIMFGPLSSQTYGVAPMTLSATATSGLPVAYVTSGRCTVSGVMLTITGAGSCMVTASQSGDDSWAPADAVAQTFSIIPAPLTISAPSPSRTYGLANPAFAPAYAGFAAGDTAASLTTIPTCTTTATATSPVGTYPVTCSGAADPNYTITYAPGTLTIAIVDRFATRMGATISVAAPGVLALTSGTVSAVTVTKAPVGKLTLSGNGSFTYVPKAGFTGTDSFTYQATINGAKGLPNTVTIYVLNSGASCTNCNLSGLSLTGMSLTGVNFTGANLSGTNLSGDSLSGSNLSNAILAYANLGGAMLTGTNLSGANLGNATIAGANLAGANLSNAILTCTDLKGATLTGANLSKANLTGATLAKSSLTGSNLSGANLTGANLTGAATTGANFSGVTWSATTCPDGTGSDSHNKTCAGHP